MRRGMDPPEDPPGGGGDEEEELYLEPRVARNTPVGYVTTSNKSNNSTSVITIDTTLVDNPSDNTSDTHRHQNNNNNNPVELTTASAPARANNRYAPVATATATPANSTSVLEIPSAPTGGAVWGQSMIDLKREAMNDYHEPVVAMATPTESSTNSSYDSYTASHNIMTTTGMQMQTQTHNHVAAAPRYSEPSMLSIQEDVPIQFPTHQQQQQNQYPRNHRHGDQPLAPPAAAAYNRYKPAANKSKFQNEVSVDSWGLAQQMHNEISVDGFIMAHEEEWRQNELRNPQPPPKREIITNEVNVDSVLDMHPRKPVEAWRTRATSESKGLSVLQLDAPLGSEINVDSVLRLERERPPAPPQRPSEMSMKSIQEEDPRREPPKPFGPPSMLDEEINVDSVIRINSEARKSQQAKVAALHQQQQAAQQQEALRQWQEKVAKQQQEHSIDSSSVAPSGLSPYQLQLQHRHDDFDTHVSPDLNAISPDFKKSPTKEKKKGLFSKMFRRKGQ